VAAGWQRWMEDADWSDWRAFLQRIASTDWTSTDWASIDWTATEWAARPRPAPEQAAQVSLTMRAFAEDEPGDQIREHLTTVWPAFLRWWRDGANARPTTGQAGARLEEHMPELVPAWRRLAGLLGDDPDAGAALAL